MTFSDFVAGLALLRPFVQSEDCLVAAPDVLHVSVAAAPPADVQAQLIALDWHSSSVYGATVWEARTAPLPVVDETAADAPLPLNDDDATHDDTQEVS